MNWKSVTKKELQTALAGKEKTKTYKLVSELPSNFKGQIPKDIARGMCRMKDLPREAASAAAVASNEY